MHSELFDRYYDSFNEYSKDYQKFMYQTNEFFRDRHKQYMYNYYWKNKNKKPDSKIYFSDKPKTITWK